jgi:hypothetical protein
MGTTTVGEMTGVTNDLPDDHWPHQYDLPVVDHDEPWPAAPSLMALAAANAARTIAARSARARQLLDANRPAPHHPTGAQP